MRFVVTWMIDSDAADPVEAAKEARAAQLRANTGAVCFQVHDVDQDIRYDVDLAGDPVKIARVHTRTELKRRRGPAGIDVNAWPQIGPYRVAPKNFTEATFDNKDFHDGDHAIWSIARVDLRFTFMWNDVQFVVPAGLFLVSREGDLYQRTGLTCIWLR